MNAMLIAAVAACMAAAAPLAVALPQCNASTININSDKLVFAAVGNWGRTGAMKSLFSQNSYNLCRTKQQCCSSLQNPTFVDSFDATEVLGQPEQQLAATLLNDVCGQEGCQFVLGLGDSFYPCGADAFSSGINRFQSDWLDLYHNPQTVPHISNLTWYQILGNHDYGFETSVPLELQFAQNDSRWVQPEGYYARMFKAGNVSMTISFLDEPPFIGGYAHPKPNPAYFNPYLAKKMTPDYINSDAAAYLNKTSGVCDVPPANASVLTNISDSATGQIPWLKSCLKDVASQSTWNVISGHYALWGSDTEYANPANESATTTLYPGQCGAFGSLANLINEYGVHAYFNGHDLTQTHADPSLSGTMVGSASAYAGEYGNLTYLVSGPKPATQYFTLGSGGAIQYGDGVTLAQPKDYNNFSAVVYNENVQYTKDQITDDVSYNGGSGEGFAIVTADACTLEVNFYNIQDYNPSNSLLPAHTAVIDKCGKAAAPPNAASKVAATAPATTYQVSG